MHWSNCFASLFLLAANCYAWRHVDVDTLQERLSSQEHTLVSFVAPSSDGPEADARKALEKEWELVQDTEANAISIDCSEAASLCKKLKVSHFPAIRLYHQDGAMRRYRGPRTAAGIVSFLRRALRPTISPLDGQNITSFHSIDDVVFVAHLSPDDQNLHDRFNVVAEHFSDRYSFGLAMVPHPPPGIGCFNNVDNKQFSTTELDRVESLMSFVKQCYTPMIPQLTRKNELQLLKSGKSLVYYFATNDADRIAYGAMMRPLAQKYEEYLTFITADAAEYPGMLPGLGLKAGVTPALSVQNPRQAQVFPYPQGKHITWAAVEAFIMDISTGKVTPWDGTPPPSEARGHDEL